jgi:hypothetical protein
MSGFGKGRETPGARAVAVEQLHDAFIEAELEIKGALAGPDPWAADYGIRTLSALEHAARDLRPAAARALPDLGDIAWLQQAWAVATARPAWAGLLYRVVVPLGAAPSPLVDEARRLRAISQRRWGEGFRKPEAHEVALASLLMCDDPAALPVPNFGWAVRLKGGTRLRFRLAWHCLNGSPLPDLIKIAAFKQPAASDYQRRIEFTRMLRGSAAAGRKLRALREVEFALLGSRGQAFVLSLPALWPDILVASLHRRANLARHTQALAAEHDRLKALFSGVMQALRDRRLGEIDGMLAQVGGCPVDQLVETPIARALARSIVHGDPLNLDLDARHPALKDEFGVWVPMSPAAHARLSAWRGSALPAWWAMSPVEVAQHIAAGTLDVGKRGDGIPAQDLFALSRGWGVAEQVAIVRSGRGHILRPDCDGWRLLPLADLPAAVANLAQDGWPLVASRLSKLKDARPWLELMAAPGADAAALRTLAETAIDMASVKGWTRNWGQWVASSIGSPAWLAVRDVAMDRTRVLLDAVALFNDKRKPVAPVAFRVAVVDSLHTDGQLPREPLDIVLRWLEVDPAVIAVLAQRGPVGLLERLAAHKETPVPVLERLMTLAPAAVRPIAWRQRLRQVDTAGELLDFTRDLPPNPGHLPWSRKWFGLPGSELNVALVMAARRNGWRLRALRDHLVTQLGAEPGEAAFRQALAEASAMLRPAAPREAAMLELVGVLGADLAASLMRVFAMADRQAAPGHKLDGAYKRHLLPKKSGGNRVISAPELPLKRGQRGVLDTLLTPLGSHDCAYGFVPGRSIAHNAAVHVGQLVVVNADVQNCFPSVKWPLVLAALRRGLGDRLSSTAISMLCDVCTADGGLPIGAPTSPALLNRVLIKTDEVLLQAAQARGVNYTRYADDLTFSGDAGAVQMLGIARRTLSQIGLQLDAKKTNIFRRGRRQMVTGLAVNDQVSVPRNIRRRLRAAVHMAVQHGTSHWHGQEQSLLALKGRISFVKMVHEAEGAQLMARLTQPDQIWAEMSSGPGVEATAEPQAQGGDSDEA